MCPITVNAKAVVLTTGGFGANLDMVTEYKPELKGFTQTLTKIIRPGNSLPGFRVGNFPK